MIQDMPISLRFPPYTLSFMEVQMGGLVECNHLVAMSTEVHKIHTAEQKNSTQVRDSTREDPRLMVFNRWVMTSGGGVD